MRKQATVFTLIVALALFIGLLLCNRKGEPDRTFNGRKSDAADLSSTAKQEPGLSRGTNHVALREVEPVSSFVLEVISHPKRPPKLGAFPGPRQADKAKLLEQFAALGNITNKIGIARALSYEGGKDVYEVFRRTLIDETLDRTNSNMEVFGLIILCKYMGFLGRSQPEAFEFVVQGSDPAFWWNVSPYYRDEKTQPNHFLAHACILGVGLNSSSEALVRLEQLRSRVGKDLPNNGVTGAIVEGVFNHRMIEKHGIEFYMDNIFTLPITMNYLEKWIRTKEGNAWWDWSITISGAKPHLMPIPVEE